MQHLVYFNHLLFTITGEKLKPLSSLYLFTAQRLTCFIWISKYLFGNFNFDNNFEAKHLFWLIRSHLLDLLVMKFEFKLNKKVSCYLMSFTQQNDPLSSNLRFSPSATTESIILIRLIRLSSWMWAGIPVVCLRTCPDTSEESAVKINGFGRFCRQVMVFNVTWLLSLSCSGQCGNLDYEG